MDKNWKMVESKCPECGKRVYNVGKHKNQYCSKQCESNHTFRTKRFIGTEFDKWTTPEEARKFK